MSRTKPNVAEPTTEVYTAVYPKRRYATALENLRDARAHLEHVLPRTVTRPLWKPKTLAGKCFQRVCSILDRKPVSK